MNIDSYTLNRLDDYTFSFASEGKNGTIPKVVRYTPTPQSNFYTMDFGDLDTNTGVCIIDSISNNHDSLKIFSTVITSIYHFTNTNRDAYVCSYSTSKPRLRIYRIGINRYIDIINDYVHLYIDKGNSWEEFSSDSTFDGFMIKRKKESFFNTIK